MNAVGMSPGNALRSARLVSGFQRHAAAYLLVHPDQRVPKAKTKTLNPLSAVLRILNPVA